MVSRSGKKRDLTGSGYKLIVKHEGKRGMQQWLIGQVWYYSEEDQIGENNNKCFLRPVT